MAGKGSAILDFGAFPGSNEASVSVTGETGILSNSNADAWQDAKATVDYTAKELRFLSTLISISPGTITAGVGFTIDAFSQYRIIGKISVQWAWA